MFFYDQLMHFKYRGKQGKSKLQPTTQKINRRWEFFFFLNNFNIEKRITVKKILKNDLLVRLRRNLFFIRDAFSLYIIKKTVYFFLLFLKFKGKC